MNETVISWTAPNWATVILMAFGPLVLFVAIAKAIRARRDAE